MGVPAHLVATGEDFCADPQVIALGHLVSQPDPHGRVSTVEASRFRLSRTPARLDRAAPAIGRDNAQVLRDYAGYDEARIRDLSEAGVLR